ncbi:aminodeoxychorismate lyase [Phytohalomonas tamaricis]|uniref:aminodeoxychorismate lyase n=1 Tax=Phytohalomonas tamaricis TaxID=2081032 RepID=UPI000D0ABD0A|nr:aminodeoxychorismate lyase [Phytohalomonas tamaricis]
MLDAFPFDDRGVAYGDGVFETVLVRDGRPMLWEEHIARLIRGAERLGFPPPSHDSLDALPCQAGPGLSVLKIIVTRGSGGRGYLVPRPAEPRLRWKAMPFIPQTIRWEHGVVVRHCRLRLAIQPILAGIKHLNRLENVLARDEWHDNDISEGLLSDSAGRVVEATAMNLAWCHKQRWYTPRMDQCGVAGTLRQALLELDCLEEAEARAADIAGADALCVFNSVQGVWPVVRLLEPTGDLIANWAVAENQRRFQAQAHALLGYPATV